MASVHERLLNATVSAVSAMALTVGGVLVPVEKQKLPGVEESIDVVPLAVVASDPRPSRVEPWDTGTAAGPRALRTYKAQVVLVVAGNREVRRSLGDVATWRERVMRRLGGAKPLAVDELLQTRVTPGPAFEPGAYSNMYDYSPIDVEWDCIEPAFEV